MAKIAEVTPIHREDVVELVEVLGPDAACPSPEGYSMAVRNVRRAWIGGLSLMPCPRASRVDADSVGQILFLQQVRQDAFSERRTADVAQADEKNRDFVFRGHGVEFSAGRRPLKVWNPGVYP